ncbi:MAG TPA: AAA family ATPase, partial [Burkholderiales bacterium]|nr:AAA family ATPase [Burkholderiales bacterium]
MYLEYFGLNEPPFTITPHTEFFFAGANRGATLEALIYAVTHGEGIVKVSGEVGSGKTMLCRVLMERLPASVETIYLAIPSLNRDEMLGAICGDLGIVTENGAPNVQLKALQEHLLKLHADGKRVVALIDEAHAMPLDSLEEIRLLSNLETNKSKLLQIVLFGQPELDEHLAKPQMRQLRERITHSFRLSPLTLEDVLEYLRHRLRAAGYKGAEVFNSACVKLIAKTSEGLTRRINIIADKSLLAAYSANTHSVSPEHVKAAIRDSEFAAISRSNRSHWPVGGALAVGLIIGALSVGWAMKRNVPAGESQTGQVTVETIASTPSSATPRTSPSPLKGEGGGEGEMVKINPVTLSPTPLPAGERG